MKSINILEKKVTKLVGILFCMFAFVLFAPSVAAAGPTGEGAQGKIGDLTWTYSDNKLSITGNGSLVIGDKAPWENYCDDINTITVGDGVKSISDGAFAHCWSAEQLFVRDTLDKEALAAVSSDASDCIIYEYKFTGDDKTHVTIAKAVIREGYTLSVSPELKCNDISSPYFVTGMSDMSLYAYDEETKEWGQTGLKVTFSHAGKEETIPEKAATCTEPGLTEGKKCSVCGTVLKAQEVIPAGHKFNENGVCKCGAVKIIFEKNGTYVTGTMEPQIVEKEKKESAILKKNEFERNGYVFTGWNTKADGTDVWYANEASVSLVEGITLHAQWVVVKVKSKEFIVAFNGNGGTGKMSAQKSKKKSITLKKNNFRRTGYVFAGWNNKANGEGEKYRNQATIKLKKVKTLILYAQWKEKSEANGSAAAAASVVGEYVPRETYESGDFELKLEQKPRTFGDVELPPGVSLGEEVGADENYTHYGATSADGQPAELYLCDIALKACIDGGEEFEVKFDEDRKPVAITIPYPKGVNQLTLKDNNITIYHFVDGKWEKIKGFTLREKGITLSVSKLSPFAIVVKQTSASKDVAEDFSHICKTADVVTVRELYELGVLSMIALVGLCLSRRRKKV